MPSFPAKPQIQNGRIPLHPAPNRDVIDRQTALHHHFFQIAVAERVPQIPAHAQNYDDVLEVAPSEQRWSLLAHEITVPKPSATAATDPPRIHRHRNRVPRLRSVAIYRQLAA